jgi:hypothetical protein
MKKIKYILYTFLLSGLLVGCDAETPEQDVAPIGSLDRHPTATWVFNGGELTVNESAGTVYTWTVTLDKPTDRAIDFSFEDNGGTATHHDDYEITKGTVAAFDTTTTVTVTVLNDTKPEEDETISLQAISGPSLANKYLVNPNTVFPTFEATIQNYTSDVISLTFDWSAAVLNSEGTLYDTCTYGPDIDVYVTQNPVFAWADDIGNYDAATGDCPEDFDITALADGTYYFWSDLYSNANAPYWAPALAPITTTISQTGVSEFVFVQPNSDAYEVSLGGFDQGVDQGNYLLMKLVIAGDTWTATQN